MSAQRQEPFDAADDALLEAVRDELARRALGDLYDAFQAYDEAHSDEHGNASAYEWVRELESRDDPIWIAELLRAREMT